MSGDWRAGLGKFAIAIVLSGVTIPYWESMVLAQILPDETLGAESSVVTSDNIKGIESDRISGGAVRGSNLFHSFQEFNIGEGRGGYFENPAVIENIFSRVTGSNPSEILGTLGVLGNANLFFLNPNGILFGPNARLDVRGSFLATTADSILFPSRNQFSATNPEVPPILTVNVQQPIGLEFEGRDATNVPIGLSFRDNPGDIVNRSDLAETEIINEGTIFERTGRVNRIGLKVDKGQNIALIGGNVSIENSAITAPGGRVTVGGLSQAGTVNFNEENNFIFPENIEKADVSLIASDTEFEDLSTRISRISVVSDNGGFIDINARNLVLDLARLELGINESFLSDAVAGNINLTANSISLNNSSIFSRTRTSEKGTVGDINLTANSIALLNGSSIASQVVEEGTVGDINLTANSILIFDDPKITSSLSDFSVILSEIFGNKGTTGDINLTADSISLNSVGAASVGATFPLTVRALGTRKKYLISCQSPNL